MPVANPEATLAAGAVRPLANLLILSWLSCTHCRAFVRCSRSPIGPRPERASSISCGQLTGELGALVHQRDGEGGDEGERTTMKTSRKTRNVASRR